MVRPSDQELISTLFDLGRQVTSVLDFNELIEQLPQLISRLISFDAFTVYLLDAKRGELRETGGIGYPKGERPATLKVGQGIVGIAVAEQRSILVDDVTADPRYVEMVPGIRSELVVPLVHRGRAIGAFNLLSTRTRQFSDDDVPIVRQFAAQYDKQGLIIDERFNSGGQIPDRFIELLNRPMLAYWAVRDGRSQQWPPVAHRGPQVMLINGWSGSGGRPGGSVSVGCGTCGAAGRTRRRG